MTNKDATPFAAPFGVIGFISGFVFALNNSGDFVVSLITGGIVAALGFKLNQGVDFALKV